MFAVLVMGVLSCALSPNAVWHFILLVGLKRSSALSTRKGRRVLPLLLASAKATLSYGKR